MVVLELLAIADLVLMGHLVLRRRRLTRLHMERVIGWVNAPADVSGGVSISESSGTIVRLS